MHAAPPTKPFVVLRFDVDYREPHGLALAEIVHKYGLHGSFYFRHRAGGFSLDVMRAVAALGHEVGYHFETLDLCRGDFDRAAALFLDHIQLLRNAGLEIRTAAAHGSPSTAPTYTRNLDLLVQRPNLLEQAELLGETTLNVDFARVPYVSDANWRWRRYAHFEPDTVGVPTTLRAVTQHPDAALYINFHPQQWFARPLSTLYFRTRNRIGRQVRR
ncbi:MAG: hypothetical protein GYB65_16240 [Chloroflexi bacterium]|nr:hypothetical protein [Chloroflexota bacterium]